MVQVYFALLLLAQIIFWFTYLIKLLGEVLCMLVGILLFAVISNVVIAVLIKWLILTRRN